MIRIAHLAVAAALVATSAKAIDVNFLWDFSQPEVSEQRFRAALKTAAGDESLILQTQIARTYALRKDFGKAWELLVEIQSETQTSQTRRLARDAYARALSIARDAHLDALAINVVHMFAFVDTTPAYQLKWNQLALGMVEASDQAEAKRWEASIRSNMGEALFDLGRHGEALAQFTRALEIFEQARSPSSCVWSVKVMPLVILRRTSSRNWKFSTAPKGMRSVRITTRIGSRQSPGELPT